MSQSSQNNEASYVSAIKDQAVGAIKETIGSVLGNSQMELEGKAQKIHGQNEYQFAKSFQAGETEPEKFQQAYSENQVTDQGNFPLSGPSSIGAPVEPSMMTGWKDQAVGSLKEAMGSATNNQDMELKGKAQQFHGRYEAEFAKAQAQGLSEPEHFGRPRETTDAEGEVEGDKVSTFSAIKDVAIGSIKESFGSATGNQNTELAGKAQQIHGRNEAEFAKAQREGLTEPEHYTHGRKPEPAEGEVVDHNISTLGALKDRALGSMKEMVGSLTGNQDMELKGKAQNIHGRNEAEFAKAQRQGLSEPEHFAQGRKITEHAEGEVQGEEPSLLSGLKDQAMGAIKGSFGSATNNQTMELKGKAQYIHGRNEAEFAKAKAQGLTEPQYFGQPPLTTEPAQGQVEGEGISSLSAMKDVAVGSIKESFGSATGNQNTELAGKAQQIHGRNEAEFAKAQREGLTEPEHYAHGRKPEPAKEEFVSEEEPSKLTGWKDQAVGAIKETVGSATNNQKMEIEGKAQKFQGANQCANADKNTINA